MKKAAIKDIHTLSEYLYNKYNVAGDFNFNDEAFEPVRVEGLKIIRQRGIEDNVISYGLREGLYAYTCRSRADTVRGADETAADILYEESSGDEDGEGQEYFGCQPGEINYGENSREAVLRKYKAHSPILTVTITAAGVNKPIGSATGIEVESWARREILKHKTGTRRANALKKLVGHMKDKALTLYEAKIPKKFLTLAEAEYGLES